MLSDADRKKAADILITAEKERKQAVQLTKTFPDIAFEDAYVSPPACSAIRRSASRGSQARPA